MQVMQDPDESNRPKHPLVRVVTLGEFALERLVPVPAGAPDEPPSYVHVPRSEWGNRGPAMALLNVLVCRPNRRATRDELSEAIWPDHAAINAPHALESAASVLRRHILHTGVVGSLLLTLRSGGETILKLAGQQRLWVDADALLALASQALSAEYRGQDPLPLLEEAHALARGEFLEDDLYATWAQPRRHTINGVRHRVLFKLVDRYLSDERAGLAEELLFSALEQDPTDEDALCRLMVLLVEQERRQEALQLYQYTEDVLHEELAEPAVYTRELARRIRQGLVLRERGVAVHGGGRAAVARGWAGWSAQRPQGRLRPETRSEHRCSLVRRTNAFPLPVPRTTPPIPKIGSAHVGWAERSTQGGARPTAQQACFSSLEQRRLKDYSGSAPGKAISRVCSSSDQSAGGLKAIA